MTRQVRVKNLAIGGGAPVTVQSMTNTPTADVGATAAQIARLEAAGCDIVRLAVSGGEEVEACKQLLRQAKAPLVADIQFDYRLAIACSDIGMAKVRFNPGNIGSEDKIRELVAACKANGTPIRIGVNSGSLEKDLLEKFGNTAEALSESALRHARLLEKFGFYDIVLSAKASDVPRTVETYQRLSRACDYPLHIGVTESGAGNSGLVKSAVGLGALLLDGIGDTVRVSLTGDPVEEVKAARLILRAVGLDKNFVEIVSCPTCSRCKYDMERLVGELTRLTEKVTKPLKIAVMGCVVNGPGEAADADAGIAGGDGKAVVFKKGKVVLTAQAAEAEAELKRIITELIG